MMASRAISDPIAWLESRPGFWRGRAAVTRAAIRELDPIAGEYDGERLRLHRKLAAYEAEGRVAA
ncbi:MAG: hypothetical protein AB7P02_05120 [Alphaproteobacteria bacterium]